MKPLACLALALLLAPPAPAQQGAPPAAAPAPPSQAEAEADRLAVWNSPEALRARLWLDRYLRSTDRYTPKQGRAYVEHLETLSAEDLRGWLDQIARFAEAETARQEEAVARQHANLDAHNRWTTARQNASLQQQRLLEAQRAEARAAALARQQLLRVAPAAPPGPSFRADIALQRELERQQQARTWGIIGLLELQELREEVRQLRDAE